MNIDFVIYLKFKIIKKKKKKKTLQLYIIKKIHL